MIVFSVVHMLSRTRFQMGVTDTKNAEALNTYVKMKTVYPCTFRSKIILCDGLRFMAQQHILLA